MLKVVVKNRDFTKLEGEHSLDSYGNKTDIIDSDSKDVVSFMTEYEDGVQLFSSIYVEKGIISDTQILEKFKIFGFDISFINVINTYEKLYSWMEEKSLAHRISNGRHWFSKIEIENSGECRTWFNMEHFEDKFNIKIDILENK